MLPLYQENEYYEKKLSCSNCGWTGLGYDAVLIDFFGVTDQHEVHCPTCDKKIGNVQKNRSPSGESPTDLGYQIG